MLFKSKEELQENNRKKLMFLIKIGENFYKNKKRNAKHISEFLLNLRKNPLENTDMSNFDTYDEIIKLINISLLELHALLDELLRINFNEN